MSFYKIRPRSGTAAQWSSANTVLGEREIGFEVPDAGAGKGAVKMKMGDGNTPWNSLPYAINKVEEAEGTFTPFSNASGLVDVKQFGKVVHVNGNVNVGVNQPLASGSYVYFGTISGVSIPLKTTCGICDANGTVFLVKLDNDGRISVFFPAGANTIGFNFTLTCIV